MSHFGAHAKKCREISGRQVDKCRVHKELQATTASWLHWYHQGKAYNTKVGTRSYAQVVASCPSTHSLSKVSRSGNNHQVSTYISNTKPCSGVIIANNVG